MPPDAERPLPGSPAAAGVPGIPELPPGFRLGTSTSAYQVEGAWDADGKGPSIWDTFAHAARLPGEPPPGDVACDHYHRYEQDVERVRRAGVSTHRLSISWPRVQPTGSGAFNAAGLAFYDRLVDRLLDAGVQPMVTLHQWDLPQALEDDGGWLNRATADRFAEYASFLGARLADRVEHWIPVDQPNVVMARGYGNGSHAPGRCLDFDALPAGHHLLLAHGNAAIALRAAGATSVGCANNHAPMWPASEDIADIAATKLFDALWNGMPLEAMLLGHYPVDLQPLLEEVVRPGDLATIRQPLDFYGISYDFPMRIALAPEESASPFEFRELLGYPTTDDDCPVVPDALREWLIMFRARFRAALPPLVVTRCGAAYAAEPGPDGVVDDQARIDYLDAHLRAVATAVQRGVDVRGFYVSALLDGVEWHLGTSQPSGLVHVDHRTQRRTPKRSFDWYADVVAAQTRSRG